jgi:hypothetical protein
MVIDLAIKKFYFSPIVSSVVSASSMIRGVCVDGVDDRDRESESDAFRGRVCACRCNLKLNFFVAIFDV